MKRATSLLRRVALVELTRAPAPPDYDHTPHNREQHRQLARKLRQANAKKRGR